MSWQDDVTPITDPDQQAEKTHVPFDGKTMLGYGEHWRKNLKWYPFTRFFTNMRIKFPDCISRGRSSTKLHLIDGDGLEYEVFMRDIGYIIRCAKFGTVEGTWMFRKQGSNYGLYLERGFTPDPKHPNLVNPVPTDDELEKACKSIANTVDRMVLDQVKEKFGL